MLNVSYKDLFSRGCRKGGSGDMYIFMQLQGKFPLGVVLDIFDDQGGDDG